MIPNNSVNTNGFSLAFHLNENVRMQDIVRLWPDAEMDGYYDPEKGYDDGIEAGFSTPNGNFYLYSRWGNLRLGCIDGWNNPHALEWIMQIYASLASGKGQEY